MKIYKEQGEDLGAIKVLIDSVPIPSGYIEVTDIFEFKLLASNSWDLDIIGWTDKLCFRKKLKQMVYLKMGVVDSDDVNDQSKWDLLSEAEKRIAAEYFLVYKKSFQLEVENSDRYWIVKASEYRDWTQECRERRLSLCDAIVFSRILNIEHAKLILTDLNQIAKDTVIDRDDLTKKLNQKIRVKRLGRMYIQGLEDEEHDGVVAIVDWVKSTPGTPFENNGFFSLSYPFKEGHTTQSVSDELLSIINGEF